MQPALLPSKRGGGVLNAYLLLPSRHTWFYSRTFGRLAGNFSSELAVATFVGSRAIRPKTGEAGSTYPHFFLLLQTWPHVFTIKLEFD